MRKRSNRLPVLLIVLAAFIFICIACLFIWLKNNNNSENKFLKEKQEGNLNKIYPTTTSQIKETTKTTTEEEESSELTGNFLEKESDRLTGNVFEIPIYISGRPLPNHYKRHGLSKRG